MARNNNRGGNRGNSRSEYGVMDMARERPLAAAAAAAAAVGAGVFLWSRRNQISDQISNLSDQIGEWTQNMNLGGQDAAGTNWRADDTAGLATTGSTGTTGSTRGRTSRSSGSGTSSRAGMSETGGGNASLGAQTGGSGAAGAPSGRGRARQSPTS